MKQEEGKEKINDRKAVNSIGARVTQKQYDFILRKAKTENKTVSEWIKNSMYWYVELQKNVDALYECVEFCEMSACARKDIEAEIALKKAIDFLEPLKERLHKF